MKRILQKFQINNAGRIIRGILYLPSAPKTMELQAERFPLILYSHELGKIIRPAFLTPITLRNVDTLFFCLISAEEAGPEQRT